MEASGWEVNQIMLRGLEAAKKEAGNADILSKLASWQKAAEGVTP